MRIAFVDVDYLRGSQANGYRRTVTSAPETWVVERTGIVWAQLDWAADPPTLTEIEEETIAGAGPVGSTLRSLEAADQVVGHGLLTSDYRAMNMVARVPPELVDRTIDTLSILYEVRRTLVKGSRYPTGLNLTDLALHTLGVERQKPVRRTRAHSHLEVRTEDRGRGDVVGPVNDAYLIARLWTTMHRTGCVNWGTGQRGSTSHYGTGWTGVPGQAVGLSEGTLSKLRGEIPTRHRSWVNRLSKSGTAFAGGPEDFHAAQLFILGNDSHACDLQPIENIATALAEAGHLDRPHLTREDLLSGVQFLGPMKNIDLRERLLSNKSLTPSLHSDYAWALYQAAHPDVVLDWIETSKLAKNTATGAMRWAQLQAERQRLQTEVHEIGIAAHRG